MIKLVRKGFVIAGIIFILSGFACTPKFYPVSEKDSIKKDVYYLASENLKGRKAGEKGDSLAAVYIRDRFKNEKLRLMGDNGFQPFDLITSVELGTGNRLALNGQNFEINKDFLPYSFSSVSSFTGKVVFAGYGLEIRTDSLKWNDYQDLDVRNKWVLILKGDPEMDKSDSRFVPYSEERSKVLTAVDHQAGGVLLAGGPSYSENDQLQGLFYDKNSSNYPIPVFQITRKIADQILAPSGNSVAGLETGIITSRKSVNIALESTVTGQADVIPHKAVSRNIIAIIPGKDKVLRSQSVIIGAHYDHLGLGGPGSGSRVADTVGVHFGADDNASGVAAVLDLAGRLKKAGDNRRSLVFVAFGAEEMGLVGSKAFTDKPSADLRKTSAMFNFDMVGRLDTTVNTLSVGGTLTSKESERILTDADNGLKLVFSGEGIGPSDHASFYLSDIPVFYFSTGAHPDYHTPADTPDKINYGGILKINDLAYKVIHEVANRDSMLTYREAGSKATRSRGGRFKVTLGIIPDYAGMEKRGLKVDGVTRDKPAYKAGLQRGDIITAINGKQVGNIYDYMNRLQTLSAGETISVDLIRNDQHMVVIVQL